jgi:heterokaryon incompatibility protein (HET)
MDTEYQYRQLSDDPLEIRVLHLSQTPGDELYCTIKHVYPGKANYACLSYAWGSREKPYKIHVRDEGGKPLGYIALTENLKNALHDLRDASGIIHENFWVDQICIHQFDKVEQSHQVAMMAKIYEKAVQVITYMGPTEENDDIAIDLMNKIHTQFEPYYHSKELDYLHLKTYAVEKPPRHLQFTIKPNDPAWQAVCGIFGGSWTKRLWMVQENVLNKNTIMLRGHRVVPVEVIHGIMRLGFLDLLPQEDTFDEVTMAQWQIGVLRERIHYPGLPNSDCYDHDLLFLLVTLVMLECQDPRDRLFAVLGIASNREVLNIKPDYTKPIEEIFREVSVRLLSVDNQLSLLRSWPESEDKITRRPTWVPPFDDFYKTIVHSKIRGKVANTITSDCKFEDDNTVLVTNGFVLTKVSENLGKLDGRLTDAYCYPTHELYKQKFDNTVATVNKVRQRLPNHRNLDSTIWFTLNGEFDPDVECELTPEVAGAALRAAFRIIRARRGPSADIAATAKHAVLKSLNKAGIRTPSYSPEIHEAAMYLIKESREMGRALCITEDKHVALAPSDAQPGDIICVFLGGEALYMLRPVEDGKYIYVGDAYIHGFMDGQPVQDENYSEKVKQFRIV